MSISALSLNSFDNRFYHIPQARNAVEDRVHNYILDLIWRGIGVAIAIASITAAFVVTPFAAFGLIPAALCFFVPEIFSMTSISEDMKDDGIDGEVQEDIEKTAIDPLGIPNEPRNNCWAAVLMQLILNIPTLEELIMEHPNYANARYDPFRDFITNYREKQRDLAGLARGVSIQTIREACCDLAPLQFHRIPNFGASLDNAFDLIVDPRLIPDGSSLKTPMIKRRLTGDFIREEMIMNLYIQSTAFERHAAFDEALDEAFIDGTYSRKLRRAPEEFMFKVDRIRLDGRVDTANHPIPSSFQIPEKFIEEGETAEYECNVFGLRTGERVRSGHYIAYVKTENGWWKCNDGRVQHISDRRAKDAMQRASIFHFRKVQ